MVTQPRWANSQDQGHTVIQHGVPNQGNAVSANIHAVVVFVHKEKPIYTSPGMLYSFSFLFLSFLSHPNIHHASSHFLSHSSSGTLRLYHEHPHYWWKGDTFVLHEITKELPWSNSLGRASPLGRCPPRRETS